MTRCALLLATLTTLLIVSGCAPTSVDVPVDPASDLERAPAWVSGAPDAGRVMSALGTSCGSDDDAHLRRSARSDARRNLAAKIAERLKPVLHDFTPTEDTSRQDVVDAVVSISLYGVHTERYWVGPSGTCYVRYEIPVEAYRANVLALGRVPEDVRTMVAASTWTDAGVGLAR